MITCKESDSYNQSKRYCAEAETRPQAKKRSTEVTPVPQFSASKAWHRNIVPVPHQSPLINVFQPLYFGNYSIKIWTLSGFEISLPVFINFV